MKLLVTGAWKCTLEQLNILEKHGHQITYMQNESDELLIDKSLIEGVICNNLFSYHKIEEFTSLKVIQVTSAGLDRLPLDYINSHDIKLFNASGIYSIPMAEFVIGGILQIYKQTKFFVNNQSNQVWNKNRDLLELYNKNVYIVGCGSIGTECAKRLHAFGTNVTGFDILLKPSKYYDMVYHINELKNMISKADIVILTLPLNPQTMYLFNDKMFELMKKGSVLVNVSRGQIIEQKALVKALDKKLLGAVIDVFEEEPLPQNHPLWEKENIIITPHNSFVGDGNNNRLFELIVRNIGEL